MVTVPISLNNLKTKVDDLDVGKFKTVIIESKDISDVVSKKVVKNKRFNMKVINLEKFFW